MCKDVALILHETCGLSENNSCNTSVVNTEYCKQSTAFFNCSVVPMLLLLKEIARTSDMSTRTTTRRL